MLKKLPLANVFFVTISTILGLGLTAEKPVLALSATLTTTFDGGNGLAGNAGNMFDVNTFSNPITVTSLDVSTNTTGALTVNVYTKLGTYVGFETNSAAWSLVSTGSTTATTSGNGSVTAVNIADFTLAPNTLYGMYVQLLSPGVRYTNGANTYSNTDLQITTGKGIAGNFGSGGVFTPRTWNGRIYYNTPDPVPFEFSPSLGFLLVGGAIGFSHWKKLKSRKN